MPQPPSAPPPKSPPPSKNKLPSVPKVQVPRPAASKKSKESTRTPKTFTIAAPKTETYGQKILLYGKSGIGKSTLAALKDNVVFISVDDGARNILHPATSEPIRIVQGIESYQDIRDAFHQSDLFPEGCTIVVDTITKTERWAETHVIENIPHEKGARINNLNDYGWGAGFRHIYDHMRYLLTDMDRIVATGRNVILLAQVDQVQVSNAEGFDYLEDGPKLQDNKLGRVRTEFIEWCDHVVRVSYLNFDVRRDSDRAKTAKVIDDSTVRGLFTGGAAHYVAKTRPLPGGGKLPEVISFETELDNSLWVFLFGEKVLARTSEDTDE